MNIEKFSKYTENIKSMLPFWFSMKKKPNDSVGFSFLHIFGMELDDIERMLNYAQRQYYIDTADTDMQDIVYKAHLPVSIDVRDVLGVYTGEDSLSPVHTLYEFYLIKERIDSQTHNLNQHNIFFMDEKSKSVFVRKPYHQSERYEYGAITINYKGQMIDLELELHHVWNFFDEFGLLLGIKRLFGEDNRRYKNRILDVFKHPASSTTEGLANALARELDLRERKVWSDMSKDFIIKDDMVLVDTITVNDNHAGEVFANTQGELVLKGSEYLSGTASKVEYIRGINLYALNSYEVKDSISNELYLSDGAPTKKLLDRIAIIREKSSILWNDFFYDEVVWVKDDESYYDSHFAFIPNKLDAKIGGFKAYGFI